MASSRFSIIICSEIIANFITENDRRLKQLPVVLLEDCLGMKIIKSFGKRKGLDNDSLVPTTLENGYIDEPVNGLLTPGASSSSSVSDNAGETVKKRRKSKKLDDEYEVEKVVGYHLDKKKRMTYLLKWKGWGDEFNTYQTIEDMGKCNRLLMEYFEFGKPSRAEFAKMDKEVEQSVFGCEIYNRLINSNFKKSEFLRFMSTPTPDLSLIFTDKYETVHREIDQEYEYIIRCLIGMCNHRDPGMFARAQQYKIALILCKMRETQLKLLKEREELINRVEKCLVRVVNEKDLDVLPHDLNYVNELVPAKGVMIPSDPFLGCNCTDGCSPKSKCCPSAMNSDFAYTKDGKLRRTAHPIYECNWRCSCPPDCRNRVVQRDRTISVAIFKTEHCGWGVKTLQEIPKGTFICEYFGEVISEEESVVREVDYFPKNMSYMFDLDFTQNKESQYCIDATRSGNFSRYLNHSCDPNLVVRPVWINCLDPYMPRIAFFSRRYIRKGEELCFDYESRVEAFNEDEGETIPAPSKPSVITKNRCYCNKPKCREWLFGSL